MLEMVWRREQLETLIKVAQSWVQDHASEVARTPTIQFMGALERLRYRTLTLTLTLALTLTPTPTLTLSLSLSLT